MQTKFDKWELLIPIFRFLVVGGGISLVYILGTTVGVEYFRWPVLPTNIGFYLLSTALGYILNYFWTFGSTTAHGAAFGKYLFVAAIGFALNTGFIAVSSVAFSIPVIITTTIFTGSWAVISFFLQRNFIYK